MLIPWKSLKCFHIPHSLQEVTFHVLFPRKELSSSLLKHFVISLAKPELRTLSFIFLWVMFWQSVEREKYNKNRQFVLRKIPKNQHKSQSYHFSPSAKNGHFYRIMVGKFTFQQRINLNARKYVSKVIEAEKIDF